MQEPLRYSRKQAAELLGISTRHLDARTLTGALKCLKDGSRTFYTKQQLEQYARRDQMEAGQ